MDYTAETSDGFKLGREWFTATKTGSEFWFEGSLGMQPSSSIITQQVKQLYGVCRNHIDDEAPRRQFKYSVNYTEFTILNIQLIAWSLLNLSLAHINVHSRVIFYKKKHASQNWACFANPFGKLFIIMLVEKSMVRPVTLYHARTIFFSSKVGCSLRRAYSKNWNPHLSQSVA